MQNSRLDVAVREIPARVNTVGGGGGGGRGRGGGRGVGGGGDKWVEEREGMENMAMEQLRRIEMQWIVGIKTKENKENRGQ